MVKDYLEDSAREFSRKKQACVDFIDNVVRQVEAYRANFTIPEEEDKENTASVLDLKKLAEIREKISASSLKILIAGQFKAGKSTVINALLGEKVLPAYSIPCTAVITEITWGETPCATLVFKKDLGQIPEDLDPEARRHIESHPGNVPDLVIRGENFKKDLERFLVIPMSEKEQKQSVAESPYALCRLSWPLELCRNNTLIIDSPGLNEASARDETTYGYAPQADIILHVMSALQCYGKPDQEFIQKIRKFQKDTPILYVINRFDQLDDEENQELLRKDILGKLLDQSTYGKDGIFFISALSALKGRQKKNEEQYRESGYPEFTRKISEVFDRDRGKVKLGNVKYVCESLDDLITIHIPAVQEMMGRNAEKLEKDFTANRKKFDELERRKTNIVRRVGAGLDNLEKQMRMECVDFFESFRSNQLEPLIMAADIDVSIFSLKESAANAVARLEQVLKAGLADAFEEWVEETGAPLVQEALDDIQDQISHDLRQFNEELADLCQAMAMQKIVQIPSNKAFEDEAWNSLLAGALLGGIGGIAAALAAAFLLGPIGWIAALIGTALGSLLGLSSIEDSIKEKFIEQADKTLGQKQKELSGQIAGKLVNNLKQGLAPLTETLSQQIESVKRPILEAIAQLKQDESKLQENKHKLEAYKKTFGALAQEGRDILAKL